MAYQFQPIGPAGGKGLPSIQVPKLQAAPKLQTGTPIRAKEEPDTKDQLTGALLGMVAPSLGRLGVKGLGALLGEDAPDWLKLEKEDERIAQEEALEQQQLAQMSAPERYEYLKRKQRVEQFLPKYKTPTRPTALGQLIEGIGSVAPAFFLDEDAADPYIKGVQAGTKRLGDYDDSVLQAALSRLEERGKVLGEDIDLDRETKYSAYLDVETNRAVPVTRDTIKSSDGLVQWVVSQGDPNVDFYYDSNTNKKMTVPRGQAYSNNRFAFDDQDLPSAQQVNFINEEDPTERAYGVFYPEATKPDGTRGALTIIQDPDGGPPRTIDEWRALKKNWILDQRGIEGAPALKKGKQEIADMFADRDLAYTMLNGVLDSGHVVLSIAKDAVDNPEIGLEAFTNTGVLANRLFNSLNNEIATLDSFVSKNFGLNTQDIITTQMRNAQANNLATANVLGVYAAANNHAAAYQNYTGTGPLNAAQKRADQDLIDALARLEGGTSGEIIGRDGNVFSFGDRDTIRQNVVTRGRLIAAQIRLAYSAAAASGQTGRTLSDKDVANFLQQVGYESSEPKDVGTRTAEFIASQIRQFDTTSPTFSNLLNLSRSQTQGDITNLNEEISNIFRIEPSKLKRLMERDETGNFVLSEDEADALRSEIKRDISINSNARANPFFAYNPQTRRWTYQGFEDQFKKRATIDPVIKRYMDRGGYFDTFNINKDTFLYESPEDKAKNTQQGTDKPPSYGKDLRR
tara:strand:- start:6066 stop:8288 length:2223 start_codon:yes stop_codon:yes gene_type:complete